jgi:hypothetical protein
MENNNLKNEQQCAIHDVSGSIIADLEARVYSLSLKHSKMKVGDFKNIPEVKEIMTTIVVLEKYYR